MVNFVALSIVQVQFVHLPVHFQPECTAFKDTNQEKERQCNNNQLDESTYWVKLGVIHDAI